MDMKLWGTIALQRINSSLLITPVRYVAMQVGMLTKLTSLCFVEKDLVSSCPPKPSVSSNLR